MAAARGFFDQYSVFCVFGSVVGCVVVPLITQSFESLIFSAIVITLTANRLSKRVLANEQRSAGHSPTAGAERRRATAIGTSGSLASGKKRKKSGWPTSQQQGSLNFDYDDLRRRREEEEEVKRREMEQREEDRREKKARKKMERRERKEQERIIREKEEEEKQKRLEARLNHHHKRSKGSGTAPPSLLEMDFPHHQIETISSWRDQPVQRASSTSSIASSSSNCSNPSPRHLRPQSPPTRKPYRPPTSSSSSSSSRPWYLPMKQVLKPCSISYDASGPSLTAPPPPPPPPVDAGSSTWVSGSSKPKETESTSTVSALRIEDVEPGRFVTEDLLKSPMYDSPFTEPLPVFNSYNPFGANGVVDSGVAKESTTSDPGPRLYSLFGQEAKSGMFGQLVGNESV